MHSIDNTQSFPDNTQSFPNGLTQASPLQGEVGGGFLRRAIELAEHGHLSCAPNPMVGAVVVGPPEPGYPEGRILGEGYHIRAGEGHAEVNALNSVKKEDWPLLKESTIYVSLEPCAHYGRTPPCAELIIKRGLKRCVIGCQDPFGRVNGKGIQMLRDAGVEVVLAPENIRYECLQLNKKFVCQHRLGRPFITLKWAQINLPTGENIIGKKGERLLISTPQSVMWGHRLRAEHQAIVVGHGTLKADAPHLNVRYWAKGNTPYSRHTSSGNSIFVLGRCSEDELPRGWQAFATIDDLLEHLQRQGIQSLLVEGGAQVLQSFIERDLWDEVWVEERTADPQLPLERGEVDARPEEGAGFILAPTMPTLFKYTREEHFGSTFLHYRSPLLETNYDL